MTRVVEFGGGTWRRARVKLERKGTWAEETAWPEAEGSGQARVVRMLEHRLGRGNGCRWDQKEAIKIFHEGSDMIRAVWER